DSFQFAHCFIDGGGVLHSKRDVMNSPRLRRMQTEQIELRRRTPEKHCTVLLSNSLQSPHVGIETTVIRYISRQQADVPNVTGTESHSFELPLFPPMVNIDLVGSGHLDFLWPVLTIVVIDLVLSGDNAVVIGMAARRLPPRQRKVAILIGG